jgi:hypothetical protein
VAINQYPQPAPLDPRGASAAPPPRKSRTGLVLALVLAPIGLVLVIVLAIVVGVFSAKGPTLVPRDLSAPDQIAAAFDCTNLTTEPLAGSAAANVCVVGAASFLILPDDWTAEFYKISLGESGGAYATVGNFLVGSADQAAAREAFAKLGVEGTYRTAAPSSEPFYPGEPSDTPTPEPTPEPSEEPEQEDDSVGKIGDTMTFQDGLEVAITKIKMVTAGEYDDAAKDGKYLAVTVRIKNDTEKSFDPGMAQVELSYGADGDQAETGYGDGTDSYFDGKIAPGRSKSITMAWKVTAKQAKDIQISVSPSWDHNEVIFLGGIK